MREKLRKYTLYFILLLLLCLFIYVLKFLFTPIVTETQGMKYVVRPGETVKSLADHLYQKNIIQNPLLFKVLVYAKGGSKKIKSGQYLFPNGTTPGSLIDQVIHGRGLVYYVMMIVNGWTFEQLREALKRETQLTHTIENMSDADVMKNIGGERIPEGQLYPSSYFYNEGSTDIALLKRAYQLMQKKLVNAWQQRDADLPFTGPYEVLIAASLVEEEAYNEAERPVIAGVLVNRLRKHMLLQFDPTVIYGLKKSSDRSISKKDLTTKTPYNTYMIKGLPPTPIAFPSESSLLAVVHPAKHAYLYFVARGDGSHQFSATLDEHLLAVAAAKKFKPEFFNEGLIKLYLVERLNFSLLILKNIKTALPYQVAGGVWKTFKHRDVFEDRMDAAPFSKLLQRLDTATTNDRNKKDIP